MSIIPDPGWRNLLMSLRDHPDMWTGTGTPSDYNAIVGIITGYDLCDGSGMLDQLIEHVCSDSTRPETAWPVQIVAKALQCHPNDVPRTLDELTRLSSIVLLCDMLLEIVPHQS